MDLAASALGITVIPIPLFFSEAQTKHLIENSQLDTVFSDSAWSLSYFEEERVGDLDGVFYSLRAPNQSKVTFSKITYTSGSTGTPKGACLDESTLMTIVGSLSASLESTDFRAPLVFTSFRYVVGKRRWTLPRLVHG